MLKKWTPIMIATVIMSLVIWVGYYLLFPDYPLNAQETLLIVFISASILSLIQWIRIKNKKRANRHE